MSPNPWLYTAQMAPLWTAGLASSAHSQGASFTPGIGSTMTLIGGGKHAQPVEVEGVPSLTIYRRSDEATVVELARKSKYADTLTDDDLKPLKKQGEAVLRLIEDLCHGPLTAQILRELGHPYGRNSKGAMRGVGGKGKSLLGISSRPAFGGQVTSALNQINMSTGAPGLLATSWTYEQERVGDTVYMRWINTAPYAWYLAHGTVLMQAHGPFTYAPVMSIPNINMAWLAITQAAYRRLETAQMAELMEVAA